MTDHIKMALIIGAAIVVSTALYIYFSPYQSCVRIMTAVAYPDGNATAGAMNVIKLDCIKKL